MRSTFGGLEIGKRALFAQQTALNTVGHNIANANTEGYTRQRVDMEAERPFPYPGLTNSRDPGQIGTGVRVAQITRLRDAFLDRQYRNENKELGYWQIKADTYAKLEVVLNEPSDKGLQAAFDRWWKAWEDLAGDAENPAARQAVIGQAVALTETFHHIADTLQELQLDLDNTIQAKVQEINSIAQQISDLNAQISRIKPHGYTTNDLEDKRDLLIDKLSKLVDVQVTPSPKGNGMVDITIASGVPLVTGTTVNQLVVKNSGSNVSIIEIQDSNGNPLNQFNPLNPQSGELLGLLEARNTIIPGLMNKIDTLATAFAKEVNDLHKSGLNLDDLKNPNPTPEGLPFFISKSWYEQNKNNPNLDFSNPGWEPQSADDIMVNPLIQANTNKIAAAGSSAQGPADGENARAIAALKYKVLNSGLPNSSTMEGYYQLTIAQLGIESQQADRMVQNKQLLVDQVDNRRQSVSGVSLDEEMAEMIKYQHAYNAAARTITVMDQILDKMINGMGVVGR